MTITGEGLASGSSGGSNYLYATDFHNGRIDAFDANFAPATLGGSFADATIFAASAVSSELKIDGVPAAQGLLAVVRLEALESSFVGLSETEAANAYADSLSAVAHVLRRRGSAEPGP